MAQPYAPPVVRATGRYRWLGFLLCLPAAAVGIWQLLIPSVQTVLGSLHRPSFGGRDDREFIGLQAYGELELSGPLLLGAVIGLPAFAVAGGIGLVIGQLAARTSGSLRLVTRILLGSLLVVYAPIGIATSIRSTSSEPAGLALLVFGVVLAALPLVVGVAGAVGMATNRSLPALLIAAAVGLATTVATGWQLFGLPLALSGSGPGRSLRTPGLTIYELAFQRFAMHQAFAASTVLLVLLALLGLALTVVLLTSAVRVDWRPRSLVEADPGEPARGVAAIVVAAAVGVAFLVLAHPWVAQLVHVDTRGITVAQAARVVVNTWLPPLATVVVQVLVGGLAAVGLAVLRPLGDRSSWLLLAFAPGLFVGLMPLATSHLVGLVRADPSVPPSPVPPTMLSVPLLFVFTIVFAGLRRAWLADARNKGPVLLAGAGIVVVSGIVSYVTSAQSLIWNLLVSRSIDESNGPALLLRLLARPDGGQGLPQQLATPIPLLFLLGLLAAAALVATDRLTMRVGRASGG